MTAQMTKADMLFAYLICAKTSCLHLRLFLAFAFTGDESAKASARTMMVSKVSHTPTARWVGIGAVAGRAVALPQGKRYRAKSIASPKMLPGADVAMRLRMPCAWNS